MHDMEVTIDHGGRSKQHGSGNNAHDSQPKATPKHDAGRHNDLPPEQTVVQLTIYRDAYGHYEYLLLKRIDQDDAFWQVVTEPVPNHDTIAQTLKQAVLEQTGIRGFKHLNKETYSYEWYAGKQRGRDIVFAAEVSPQTVVELDKHRYSQYAWLPAEEAIQKLKWSGNKQALRQLEKQLHAQRLDAPASITQGFYGNGSSRVAGPIAPSSSQAAQTPRPGPLSPAVAGTTVQSFTDSHSPFTGNVPKRLPDRPEDGVDELKPYPDEDDDRAGEWFL